MTTEATQPDTIHPTLLAEYRPPAFLIDTVELTFDLDPARTEVASRLTLRRNPRADGAETTLRLDGEALELLSVALDGTPLGPDRYRLTGTELELPGVPNAFTLEIRTAIAPERNTELSGLYTSGGNFCTQCEAEGFRRITYFPDRPDVMARYTTTIRADATRYPVLLSNGNPDGAGALPDGRHWARWADPHPKPAYLFALVAGDLVAVRDSFTTRSGRAVALGIWVRRGDETSCDYAMRSLKTSMRWDEEVFGLEYDLDVFNLVAVSDFNMGAMENKGLNIFNTKYVLARPETATDTDYQGIERVVAHEYFHNWTGNRVTCRDWFQLSLKEGLTVFRDQIFAADQGSEPVIRIGDVRALRAAQFKEDDGPLAHPVQPESYLRIDNFYTATVYNKGAELVRMLRTLLTPAGFRRGMDLYISRHDNQAVTIEDFVAAMRDANPGADLGDFMRWYGQAGTPVVTVSDAYDPATRTYELTLAQRTPPTPGQPEKQPVPIPVAMGLLGPNGDALPTRLEGEAETVSGTRVLLLTGAEQRFRFQDVAAPPVPSLLRGFSAPVRLEGVSFDRLKFLAVHEPDPFARWDAGYQVAAAVLLDLARAAARGETPEVDRGLIAAMRATLEGADADPAFAAEAMLLPGEGQLADQMEVADPDALHTAREAARHAIGRTLEPLLIETWERLADHGPYSPDGTAIGKRALRNVCLAYLAAANGAGRARARAQFEAGRNMTDVVAALAVLCDSASPERDAALAAFYARWKDDDLVLDKWFAVQAMASAPDTLERVRALAHHPDFRLRNPNRARALLGAFSFGNPVRFHDSSGAGYAFLADHVIALDPLNATTAARLVQALGTWRRYDPRRQALMRRALERVLATPKLSRNTYEMVSKSLA
ncbi:MAG TPA: aminopeptidase N [Acetobacteraceae bacterium]|nr:aminopeptidase N [Acetobacteraceae bacterium]